MRHLVKVGKTKPIQSQPKPVLSAVEWANLPDDQMSASSFSTKDYENQPLRRLGENKPNQTQSRYNSNPSRDSFRRVCQNKLFFAFLRRWVL